MADEQIRTAKTDMRDWLKIFAILSCCIWTLGLPAVTAATAGDRLLFEHIGPEDASIPSFTVKVGQVEKSTSAVIFVTNKTFANVFALVKHGGDALSRSPRPMGTFQVIFFKEGKPDKAFTIYPETVLTVISRFRQMFLSRHMQMPEVLEKLETLLTPRK